MRGRWREEEEESYGLQKNGGGRGNGDSIVIKLIFVAKIIFLYT